VQCSRCGAALGSAQSAGSSWAQVWDVKISRLVTEWLLPMLECPCCGQVTTAAAPPGAHAGTVCYGPGVNMAAVLLAAYGNVPAERAAHLIRMLLGTPVSPGFVDRASARLDGKLQGAGFDDAMRAALAAEPALGADETPVNVLAPDTDPETGEPETGSPHVLVVRSPGREADLAAGAGVAARRGHHRHPGVLRRLPDHRRIRRLPADASPARGHPAVRRPRDPPVPCRGETRPRQPAVLGG